MDTVARVPSFRELAKQVETTKLADSKGPELKGKNVRGPSLKPKQIYLGRTWKTTVEDSDNVFIALRFIGSGTTEDNERKMFAENPRLIDMKEGDFYLFERFIDGKIGELMAFQKDDCLCFNDPAVRLTFFEIKDVTDQSKPEKPASTRAKRIVTPKKGSTKQANPPAEPAVTGKSDGEEASADAETSPVKHEGESAEEHVTTSDEETAEHKVHG